MGSYNEIAALEDAYQLKTYKKFPIAVVRGEGAHVWDTEGHKYLDFYGGHAVALTGHCHPRVVEAVKSQAEKLLFYSNVVYSDVRAKAAEAIVGVAPKGLTKVFFSNSGAEANEAALKIARSFTGREEIVSTIGSFHGRTYGVLSACGIEKYRMMHKPLHTGYRHIPFGDIEALRAAIDNRTAGVIFEPVQSMAGINIADPSYYREARRLCDEKGALLIFDEVQTGLGRTGKMFVGEHWGVTPDVITCAKGIAGGIPMGATIIRDSVAATVKMGEHGATFGGGPVSCAAALATIQVIKEERLAENAWKMGELIKKLLGDVATVRGLGLLLGIVCKEKASVIQERALAKRLLVGTSEVPDVVRLMPPLSIDKHHVEEMAAIIRGCL